MRVSPVSRPFNRVRLSTHWAASTATPVPRLERIAAIGLLTSTAAATLTIAFDNPIFRWSYCLCALAIALLLVLRSLRTTSVASKEYAWDLPMRAVTCAALGLIAIWGFAQLAFHRTEYGYATRVRSVELTAMAAVALVAASTARERRFHSELLRAVAAIGFVISVVSVLAYFTSTGKVLWIFESPYPDNWGPFLSRNDFAVFLELTFPIAMWLGFENVPARRVVQNPYLWIAAWMYAAVLASASRAGAVLVTLEAVVLLCFAARRIRVQFGVAAILFIAIAGAGTLLGRFYSPNPTEYRREIAAATLEMIAEHPFQGFGLGTFSQIYPSHATVDAGALVNHAHNDWLEWASEGGIPFAFVWLVLAVVSFPNAQRSKWGLGVIAVFVHALVDYPFAKPGLAAWTFALIGFLEADEMRKVRVRVH